MASRLPDEVSCLRSITTLIREDFNFDDIIRIERYWKPSKLDSNTVYKWLSNARRKAVSTREFDVQIKQIKKDFVEHLDKRIYVLEQLRKVKSDDSAQMSVDPWMLMALRQDTRESEALVRASLHISEILFACMEIIQHIPSEVKPFANKELKCFVNKILPVYLKQLFADTQADALKSSFESLERRMVRGDLELAKKKLSEITNLLKSQNPTA